MSNERVILRVPAKGADTELYDSEFLGGVFDLEVPDIGPVELE